MSNMTPQQNVAMGPRFENSILSDMQIGAMGKKKIMMLRTRIAIAPMG
jgi:hypothetical protein